MQEIIPLDTKAGKTLGHKTSHTKAFSKTPFNSFPLEKELLQQKRSVQSARLLVQLRRGTRRRHRQQYFTSQVCPSPGPGVQKATEELVQASVKTRNLPLNLVVLHSQKAIPKWDGGIVSVTCAAMLLSYLTTSKMSKVSIKECNECTWPLICLLALEGARLFTRQSFCCTPAEEGGLRRDKLPQPQPCWRGRRCIHRGRHSCPLPTSHYISGRLWPFVVRNRSHPQLGLTNILPRREEMFALFYEWWQYSGQTFSAPGGSRVTLSWEFGNIEEQRNTVHVSCRQTSAGERSAAGYLTRFQMLCFLLLPPGGGGGAGYPLPRVKLFPLFTLTRTHFTLVWGQVVSCNLSIAKTAEHFASVHPSLCVSYRAWGRANTVRQNKGWNLPWVLGPITQPVPEAGIRSWGS